MTFIRSCNEIATLVQEHIGDLVGNPSGGAYIKMGADGTPTKRIDQVAEDLIVDFLVEHDLCDRIISEEQGKVQVGSGDRTVFLDPIDGTFNAVAGIPFYSVSLAYAEGGSIREGYVKDLAHDEVFSAARGTGAFLNGKRIHVAATAFLEESSISVYGRKFNPGTVLRLGQKIRRWRLLGASSLELCYVACGRIDGFVDVRETLRVIDAAAGMIICEEAGGVVSDHTGEPISFPEEVTVGKSMVASNRVLHLKIIEYLR
ncbi:MAG: bifunctional fructose-bisphosphatase/inositol-phosphate phosphatase [Methanomicrobiaceae archaeon]|nr:bifunctional fructose-bisphosphatase/inositol-phosphate phosphatase [Methanomicrobiaceae archaeon]